jgi:hypothetical protein
MPLARRFVGGKMMTVQYVHRTLNPGSRTG